MVAGVSVESPLALGLSRPKKRDKPDFLASWLGGMLDSVILFTSTMVRLSEFACAAYIVGIAKEITMNKASKSNTIRIIAGQWRGRRLPVLDSQGLRPSTDRVRETLFNWLMHEVPGARCLDLFAGTGALGLECLSRGAEFVQFVELNKAVAQQLSENLVQLAVSADSACCTLADGLRFVSTKPSDAFDLVFLDPPFADSLLASAISCLSGNGWLAPGALVYIEQSSKHSIESLPPEWTLYREGRAGQSHYSVYRV